MTSKGGDIINPLTTDIHFNPSRIEDGGSKIARSKTEGSVKASIAIHRELGPDLLERVCAIVLDHERNRQLSRRQTGGC